MKTFQVLIAFLFALTFSHTATAQDMKKSSMTATKKADRVSPPKTVNGEFDDLKLNIEYSSPQVKGRAIWGELVPYNKVWRTGANEATTIEFNRDVSVNGTRLRAGKYALFTIPGETEWILIFNTEPDQWGAFKYDSAKDAARISINPEKSSQFSENLRFNISPDNEKKALTVVLRWENLILSWDVK